MALASPAFGSGEVIPAEYTCDGEDVSPQLDLVGLPLGTNALAIVVEDPDAPMGIWYHWVEFDIRAEPGDYTIERATPPIGTQGVNSWNLEGYMGPCPPAGEEHVYVFRVYALTQMLGLPPGVTAEELTAAVEEHVIATIELTGSYSR
jgi:Raf kinase inhibitor-like YbhB/YbcL family protein